MVLKVARRRRARNLTKTIWCVQPLSFSYTFEILLIALQPILKPLSEKDVPKVVQAVRQTQSRKVLLKLLSRVKARITCLPIIT